MGRTRRPHLRKRFSYGEEPSLTKLDELGLVLDSDPRRVTKTGSAQSNAPADPATDPDDPETDAA